MSSNILRGDVAAALVAQHEEQHRIDVEALRWTEREEKEKKEKV